VTDGEQVIDWVQVYCRIPEGRDVGKPVVLRPWQRDIILSIYDNPNVTRRAIVSFGRKNAKTTLAAFLLLAHLCGPVHRPNSQLFSAAQARDQAAILFELAAKIVRMSPDLAAVITIRDTRKELLCRELGTLYRALSAEASSAYGLSPSFVVHDELGQVKGPRSELYEALETATAAQDAPLSLVISTQAPTDADLFSVLIDDAKKAADPRVVLSLYTADPDDDPFDVETIKRANPAFGDFQNAAEVLAMAEDARRMPSREAEYRNLILNQRVETSNPFITRTVWQSCGALPKDDFKGLPVYGGLDLSEVRDLTACVLVAPVEGVWHVQPTFWLPGNGLRERARTDRVPYDLWAGQGYLNAIDGASSVEYEYVAAYLRDVFDTMDVRKFAFDRWNFRHLKPWLLKAGFTEGEIESKFVEFGQGFQSMSPALRDTESVLLNGKLAHGNHPVLTMCMANAVIQKDPAGNRKLSKAKSRGRIDGAVALVMAMGVAGSHVDEPAFDVMSVFA
jgi:phage terminase large subunit-like protein